MSSPSKGPGIVYPRLMLLTVSRFFGTLLTATGCCLGLSYWIYLVGGEPSRLIWRFLAGPSECWSCRSLSSSNELNGCFDGLFSLLLKALLGLFWLGLSDYLRSGLFDYFLFGLLVFLGLTNFFLLGLFIFLALSDFYLLGLSDFYLLGLSNFFLLGLSNFFLLGLSGLLGLSDYPPLGLSYFHLQKQFDFPASDPFDFPVYRLDFLFFIALYNYLTFDSVSIYDDCALLHENCVPW